MRYVNKQSRGSAINNDLIGDVSYLRPSSVKSDQRSSPKLARTLYILVPPLSPLPNTSIMVTWSSLPTSQILAPQSPRKRKAAALAAAAKVTVEYYSRHYLKQAKNTSKLMGQKWLDELLEGHPQ